jgi:hypothetical protein
MSAFLFLDMLGTVDFGAAGTVQGQLERTREALEHARDWGDSDPADTLGVARWFSDNLGLAYPFTNAAEEEDALDDVISSAGQHQLALILHGFIARGAISIDLFYADDLLLFGPALNRAVALEKSRAIYPRVVLDEAAVHAARRHMNASYGNAGDAPNRSHLALDQDDVVFVNYLAVGLGFNEEETPLSMEYLRQHRDFVRERLIQFEGNEHVQTKYRWLSSYHDWFVSDVVDELPVGAVDELMVRAARPLKVAFRPFGEGIPIPTEGDRGESKP